MSTPFTAHETAIAGMWQLAAKSATDDRGTVREFFRTSAFVEAGVPTAERWAQINITWTRAGALRGLHGEAMTKLVGVASGAALGAYVDARQASATFGKVVTVHLEPGVQVLVPAGVCNGFQALADGCQYLYCFDAEWRPGMPGVAVRPTDPALGIDWPLPITVMSDKDAAAPLFAEL